MEGSISRLVVIGATGNVGLPVVKEALARKLKVLAISRNAPTKIDIKDANLELAAVDLQKEGALLEVLKSDDTVVFCALDHAGHEEIFKNAYKAFEAKGVRRVVHTSGTTIMKIDAETRFADTEDVQRKYPFYVKAAKMQLEVSAQSKVDWTEVVFGAVIAGFESPEKATIWGKEYKLIEFKKPLDDLEILSIPSMAHYIMADYLAGRIIDVVSKKDYLRQRIFFTNGLMASN